MRTFLALALSLVASVVHAAASPNDTVVLTGSTAVITDASGNTWGVSTAACIGFAASTADYNMVTLNGKPDQNTCGVVEIAIVNGVIWHENAASMWYSRTGTALPGTWSSGTKTSPLPVVTTPPPVTPPPVVPPPVTPSSVVLSWTEPANPGVTVPITYNVYRGSSATNLTKLTNVTGLTYTDPAGSATATTYYYAVTATCASCTESAESNIVSATIAAPPLKPAAPTLTITQ